MCNNKGTKDQHLPPRRVEQINRDYYEHPDLVSVQAMYDLVADEYEQTRPKSWQVRLARFDHFIVENIGEVDKACEIGAGTGRLLESIRARVKVALDLSRRMCTLAVQQRGLVAVQGDQGRLCFRNESFDAVVCGHAAGRYTPLPVLLGEISRVLKPGGKFGLHLFTQKCLSFRGVMQPWKADLRYIPAPPPKGCHNLPDWRATNRLFFNAGLRIEKHFLMRWRPRPPYGWKVPFGVGMLFANEVVLVGRKLQVFSAAPVFNR